MDVGDFCICHQKLHIVGEQKCTHFITYFLKLLCDVTTFAILAIKLQEFKHCGNIIISALTIML